MYGNSKQFISRERSEVRGNLLFPFFVVGDPSLERRSRFRGATGLGFFFVGAGVGDPSLE